MKSKWILFFAATIWFALGVQNAVCQSIATVNNVPVSSAEWMGHANREAPRTRLIPYASEQEARDASEVPSRYFQPLGEWVASKGILQSNVYTTTFKVPFEWVDRRPFLHVGSASDRYAIEVNGKPVGNNGSHATAAEYDLSNLAKEGVNTLVITVFDGSKTPLNPAVEKPFLSDVYVFAQPRVQIRDFVISPMHEAAELGVIVKSQLLNPKTVRVYYSLQNPDGTAGPYGHRDANFEMKLEDTVRFFVPLPDPQLWSHETPHLYTLNLKLQHEGRYTEYICQKIGLRNIALNDGKMLVNGRPVTLTPDNTLIINTPVHDSIYAKADRAGIYVITTPDINTTRFGQSRVRGGNPSNDPQWAAAYIDRAVAAYSTVQTHPSAAIFTLAADGSANGYNLYESYLALKAIEPRRPIVYPVRGNHIEESREGNIVIHAGVVSDDEKNARRDGLKSAREWNSDTLYFSATQSIDLKRFNAAKQNDLRAAITATQQAVEITPLRDTVITIGKRSRSGRIYSLHNILETADLRGIVIDWSTTGKGLKTKGTVYLKDALFANGSNGVLRPDQTVEFMIDFGKSVPSSDLANPAVTLSVFRPAEPFDDPSTADKRGLVQLGVRNEE